MNSLNQPRLLTTLNQHPHLQCSFSVHFQDKQNRSRQTKQQQAKTGEEEAKQWQGSRTTAKTGERDYQEAR